MNSQRVYNFNPGPAVLPLEVLLQFQNDIIDYKGTGVGILETSHRSPEFDEIIGSAEKLLREILDIDDNYGIAFVPGGAHLQFSMVPLNLLSPGKTANYVITDYWSEGALEEAKKFGNTHIAATNKDNGFSKLPSEIKPSADCAYLHFTSNNTIYGTQFHEEPKINPDITLVADCSSDLLYKKIDVKKYGLIYACAQKNLGPAGVSIAIIKKELLGKQSPNIPVLLDYNVYIKNNSLFNTPPVFAIYAVDLMLKWIKKEGGLSVIEKRNKEKAKYIYDALDRNPFYLAKAEKTSRSLMNVTFNLPSKDLEKKFIDEAEKNSLTNLKGHRLTGGIRASIYNAFPIEGAKKLAEFMDDFARMN